jgi:signal transduction histidine kinase
VAAANERMKINSNMQKEFINVAAHQLRAPIQPILGLAEVLRDKKQQHDNRIQEQMESKEDLLNVIIRNAKRLRLLTENILIYTYY